MAVKYQGGVILCADSSTIVFFIQEPPPVEFTLLIESPIKSISFTITFASWEVELPVNRNKPPTKFVTLLTLTPSNKENCLTFLPLQECSKKSTTKNNCKPGTLSQVGIHIRALKSTQSIWGEPLWKEISQWEARAVASFTDIVMPTTRLTWLTKRPRTSASAQYPLLWKETAAQEVSSDWPTLQKKESKKNITLTKAFPTSLSDPFIRFSLAQNLSYRVSFG